MRGLGKHTSEKKRAARLANSLHCHR
uniref:Uncharacterized protein n=1 Tax=Anguilla anguilla TaxID=7936 RepID=A0A0E9VE93_ANGAN